MLDRLPFATLLSFAVVAFTIIEFDNEGRKSACLTARRVMARRPASFPNPGWFRWSCGRICLRHLPDQGLFRSRTGATGPHAHESPGHGSAGLKLRHRRPPTRPIRVPRRRVPHAIAIRPTASGRMAQEIWRPLGAEVETRWQQRIQGAPAFNGLRESLLWLLMHNSIPAFPECLL